MKRYLTHIIINFVVPVTVLLILPSAFINSRQGTSLTDGDRLLSLLESSPVTFKFNSSHPNLDEILLQFKNPSLQDNSQITVDIHSPTKSRSIVFFGSNVGDPSQVPLKFDNFAEVANTPYTVTISSNNQVHDSLYLITSNQNQPLFQTYYSTHSFRQNLVSNLYHQYNLFQQRSLIHTIIYLLVLIKLNILILRFDVKKN